MKTKKEPDVRQQAREAAEAGRTVFLYAAMLAWMSGSSHHSDGPVDKAAIIIEAIEAEGWRLNQMDVAVTGSGLAPSQRGYFLFRRAGWPAS